MPDEAHGNDYALERAARALQAVLMAKHPEHTWIVTVENQAGEKEDQRVTP